MAPNTAPSGGSPFILNLRYSGQYADAESGLNYNIHRYYAPSIGRYLRADPMGLRAGPNLYAYVRNNPYVLSDPYGLATAQFGWSFGASAWRASFVGGLGLALDSCGNLAIDADAGGGPGIGDDIEEGLMAQGTTAPTVTDLEGNAISASVAAGDGAGGTLDATVSYDSQGRPFVGAGVTVGANVGAAVSQSGTRTIVYPIAKLW